MAAFSRTGVGNVVLMAHKGTRDAGTGSGVSQSDLQLDEFSLDGVEARGGGASASAPTPQLLNGSLAASVSKSQQSSPARVLWIALDLGFA